jgi:capsule polysaccharide export protein KpsE/RkpR
VEELLDPNVRWGGGQPSVAPWTSSYDSRGSRQPPAGPSLVDRSKLESTSAEIQRLETDLAALRSNYGPQHPKIGDIETRLAALRSQQLAESSPTSLLILRGAGEFGRQLSEAEAGLKHLTQLNEKGYANAAAVESARRNLDILREEFTAQIRLLELELERAETAAQAASQDHDRLQRLHENRVVSDAELAEAQLQAATADLDVQRIQTLLELYRKAGPASPPPAETDDEGSPAPRADGQSQTPTR